MSWPRPGWPRSGWSRTALWAGAALGCAALLAACSSGGGGATTTTTTTTTSSTTSTTSATTTSTTSGTTTTTTGGASTTSTAAGASTCQPSGLSAASGQGSGAAGTISMTINFTNTSAATCTLKGYPGMQLLSSTGSSLPTNVVRGGGQWTAAAASQPPSLVTLAPQQVATFSLSYEDVPVGNETSCPTSAKAQVTAPTDLTSLTIALAIAPCGGGTIHVSPVYPA